MFKPLHRVAALIALAVLAACASDTPTHDSDLALTGHNHAPNNVAARNDQADAKALNAPSTQKALAAARAATARFHQLDVLLAQQPVLASGCLTNPSGGMGFHYLRQPLLDATVEFDKPEFVMYAPAESGKLQMGGVEYMVLAEAWDATHDSPPMFGAQVFNDHRDPSARHGLPFPHYELHVWLWTPNPEGIFTPWNPAVSCPAA